MEKLTIKAPEGYEFSGINENSEIEFVPIKKKYPLSVEDIEGRTWYLNGFGSVCYIAVGNIAAKDINNVSTKERAEAILALTQLLELRDAWNEIDGFVVDWNDHEQDKWCITPVSGNVSFNIYGSVSRVLFFNTLEKAKLFEKTFKDLILTAKELL